jgi:hypothetical protein
MSEEESDDTKEDKKGNNNDELPSPVGGVKAISTESVDEGTTTYIVKKSGEPTEIVGLESSKLTKRSFKLSKARKSKKKSAKTKKKNIKKTNSKRKVKSHK